MYLGPKLLGKTAVKKTTLNPVWDGECFKEEMALTKESAEQAIPLPLRAHPHT